LADINVWLALSWGSHPHSASAWEWFRSLTDDEVLFCRLTQLGLLRLLNTDSVMGADCLTVKQAWAIYDRWMRDPKVEYRHEPAEVERLFRNASDRFAHTSAPRALGDCYLLGMSRATSATLVTFDAALARLAAKFRHQAILLK
jgi:hypothetical protein